MVDVARLRRLALAILLVYAVSAQIRMASQQPISNPPGTGLCLCVVIPAYNEEATIAQTIARVRDALARLRERGVAGSIIVVDDASTDATPREIVSSAGPDLTPLRHERNQGKGGALRTGFAHALSLDASDRHVVLVQDADLEYDPRDYPRLLGPFLDDAADVVLGSRFVGGEAHRVLYFWHSVGNRVLTLLSNCTTNLNLTDMECGPKAFRAPVLAALTLRENGFGIEPEIVAKVARLRVRVFEVGVTYNGRTYAEGKKITWRDGVRALWVILRCSFD